MAPSTDHPLVVLEPPRKAKRSGAGLAAYCALAVVAYAPSGLLHRQCLNVSTLTVALILGLATAKLIPAVLDNWSDGVAFSKKYLPRFGVVLFGFRLTVADFQAGGLPSALPAIPVRLDLSHPEVNVVEVSREKFLSRFCRDQSDSNTGISVVEARAASTASSPRASC